MAAKIRLSHDDYTVGWICALPIEMAAAQSLLDEVHECLPVARNDLNNYTLGRVGDHNIVIACLPSGIYGSTSAAAVAMWLLSTFHSIRFGLMVGIGGGIPSDTADIRLGDIVVSKPTPTHAGVVQYDFGKAHEGRVKRTGILNHPPQVLLTALSKLQANSITSRGRYAHILTQLQAEPPGQSPFERPTQKDCLYEAEHSHVDPSSDTCASCDCTRVVTRPTRNRPDIPIIHYGLVASGNQVVKDAKLRDKLGRELGALCVEMEAAGLMNSFPSLVIRGICDYADSHKNKAWQGYASAAAAAFTKELLLVVSGYRTKQALVASDVVFNSASKFRVPLNLRDVPAIEKFIGRKEDLSLLWDRLQPLSSPMRKIVVLHGLGGMGKTQLAIRFARIHKNDFTSVFWFNAQSKDTLIRSMASASLGVAEGLTAAATTDEAELEQRAQVMLNWLSIDGNFQWLIIFDNVDDYPPVLDANGLGDGYNIEQFFPKADQGSIIITSRRPQLSELGEGYSIPRLSPDDSMLLLSRSSCYDTAQMNKQKLNPDMQQLADCLGGLPLALSLAGSYICQTGMSISQYLRHYRASWRDLMADSTTSPNYPHGNLLVTWKVTLEKLQDTHPAAARLLPLLAVYDNNDIWYELVRGGAKLPDAPDWLLAVTLTELSFVATMRPLLSFSMLQSNEGGGGYSMHPVVQDWCLNASDDIKCSEKLDTLKATVLGSLGHAPPIEGEREESYYQQRLLPHATRMLRLLETWSVPKKVEVYDSVHNLGCLFLGQGRLREAEKSYQHALMGRERLLGSDDRWTLETVNNLGLVYTNRGKYDDAERACRRALSGRQETLGGKHVSTLDSANTLGFLYTRMNKLPEAEKMLKMALTGYENALGKTHSSTLDTLNNLGLLYTNLNELGRAEAMYKRAMAGFEKLHGPHHTSTTITANNLGTVYESQGKIEDALHMYQRALDGYANVFGSQHKSTLMVSENIANIRKVQETLDSLQKPADPNQPEVNQKATSPETARSELVAEDIAQQEPTHSRAHSHAFGKVSYSRGGRSIPSMVGWWSCCHCGSVNNPGLCSSYCSICGHEECLTCWPAS
ncbi:hypothetical protein BDW74DRAFT_174775 [Aspergillus multicolor]|uniref:uncharacterized protein n=1 Tax=Aspergillus multicolor TaxID=41759 RepID=UPI003CCC9AC9